MLGFFKRKRPAGQRTEPNGPLAFKSAAAALEYACKFMDCSLSEGSSLPAVILDSRQEFGTQIAVKIQDDGNQVAAVRVASDDGGFTVIAATAGPQGPRLQPGELVAWQAMRYDSNVARASDDKRFGWVGLIVGTLEPEYRNGSWLGGEKFSSLRVRFFNWHARPAVIRDTPPGGLEALFVPSGASTWSRASPVEVLESGAELSSSDFAETFPDAPALPPA